MLCHASVRQHRAKIGPLRPPRIHPPTPSIFEAEARPEVGPQFVGPFDGFRFPMLHTAEPPTLLTVRKVRNKGWLAPEVSTGRGSFMFYFRRTSLIEVELLPWTLLHPQPPSWTGRVCTVRWRLHMVDLRHSVKQSYATVDWMCRVFSSEFFSTMSFFGSLM